MKEQILIRGCTDTRRKGFIYFGSACCIWAIALLYAVLLYSMNVKGCHYAWTEDSCFPKWEYSFFEFLTICMGQNTFFVSLTVLIWCAVLYLLAVTGLYFAFRNNEITVTNYRVYGKAAFGSQVQIRMFSALGVEGCPRYLVKLKLFSYSLLFGGIKNKKEVLAVLEKSINQQVDEREIAEVPETGKLESETVFDKKLGIICFLPLFLFVILLAIGLYRIAPFCQEMYQSFASIREEYTYLEYWFMWTLGKDLGHWIKGCFLLSLVGICWFFKYRSSKLILSNSKIIGKSKWGRHLDINVNSVKGVAIGPLGKLTLYTDSGKFVFGAVMNRKSFYEYFSDNFQKTSRY